MVGDCYLHKHTLARNQQPSSIIHLHMAHTNPIPKQTLTKVYPRIRILDGIKTRLLCAMRTRDSRVFRVRPTREWLPLPKTKHIQAPGVCFLCRRYLDKDQGYASNRHINSPGSVVFSPLSFSTFFPGSQMDNDFFHNSFFVYYGTKLFFDSTQTRHYAYGIIYRWGHAAMYV